MGYRPKLNILFQDEDFVVVSKPEKMVVHPGQGGCYDRYCVMKDLRNQIDQWVYPVHRLDRAVSGCLIFGLSSEITSELMQSWHSPTTKKYYFALVRGLYEEPGKFDFALSEKKSIHNDGVTTQEKVYKDSLTLYSPITHFIDPICKTPFTFCYVQILTGRTHQIRRHFAHNRSALVGDTTYGKARYTQPFRDQFKMNRLVLHSHRLEFLHPRKQEIIVCEDPIGQSLKNLCDHYEITESKIADARNSLPQLSLPDSFQD